MLSRVKDEKQIKLVSMLAKHIWPEVYQDILSFVQIDYMLDKFLSEKSIKKQIESGTYYYLIKNDNEAIGFISFDLEEQLHFSKFYLKSEYRNKGYGKKVFSLLKKCKRPIVLRVNKKNSNAYMFYKKLGFKDIKSVKTDIGKGFFMDDYLMRYDFTFNDLLETEKEKLYFQQILKKIEKEAKTNIIYPPKQDWFKALELTELKDVKVVMIGQDPYHNPNQAMGLCFSVPKDTTIPPSLKNIYQEIKDEYNIEMPNHGDLTNWAKQGVLLLNAIFTVSQNKPLSHKDFGWQTFTDEIIKLLQQKDFVVYILLGSYAQSYIPKITNKNHLIIKSSHPSPLSYYRSFKGSNVFIKANKGLIERNIAPIKWDAL